MYFGELSALMVAVFWAISAFAFEKAGKEIGSLAVNVIRLVGAFLCLTIYLWITRKLPFPTDATLYNWVWLSLSGFVGFVLGDLFLFKAFNIIGSRLALLVMNLAPPIAAFCGWLFLGENLSWYAVLGIVITFGGISLAVFNHSAEHEKIKLKIPVSGLLLALGGAVGQALGLILSKKGMNGYDAFASTQIRIITGMTGFFIVTLFLNRTGQLMRAVNNR